LISSGCKEAIFTSAVVAAFTAGLASGDGPVSGDATLASAQGVITDLVSALSDLDACEIEAGVTVEFFSDPGVGVPVGVPVAGEFHYLASGAAWRKRSFLDPALVSGMDTDIIYDGATYAYATPGSDVLAIAFEGGDDRAAGMALPNPLYGIAMFLTDIQADVTGQDVTLTDLRSDALSHDPSTVSWKVDTSPDRVVGSYPAGHLDILAVENRVVFLGQDEPLVIERRLAPNNALLMRVKLDNWRPISIGGTVYSLPRSVVFEGMDHQGNVGVSIDMSISDFTSDGLVVEDGAFDIPVDESSTVWVEDTQDFLP